MTEAHAVVEAYVAAQPGDAGLAASALATADATALVADLAPASAATLLQHMAPGAAAACLAALDGDTGPAVSRELPIEILAGLLRRTGDRAAPLLDALEPDVADPVRRLLSSPDGTAGAVMDPTAMTIPAASTAREARALVQREAVRLPDYVYAVDARQVLAGVVDVAALMAAPADAPVTSVTRGGIDWVRVEMPLEAVEAHPGWLRFDVLPVVDADQRFVGLIRHRRLRQMRKEGGAASGDDGALRTLVALGEVYWLGLSGLMHGIAAAAAANAPVPGSGGEGRR